MPVPKHKIVNLKHKRISGSLTGSVPQQYF